MGNNVGRGLSASESITKSHDERVDLKKKHKHIQQKMMSPKTTQRGLIEQNNAEGSTVANSIIGKNLPLMSLENNKYFHPFPDNKVYHNIRKNKKINVLPAEYAQAMKDLEIQLDEAENHIQQYQYLLNESKIKAKELPKILMEIISGHQISATKSK